MNKIKSLPDAASLILRLVISIPYLYTAFASIPLLSSQPAYNLALFFIVNIAALFILLGFLTRWATLTVVVYFLVSAGAALQGNSLWTVIMALLEQSTIVAVIAVWLLNSGKYSVDHLIAKKKKKHASA